MTVVYSWDLVGVAWAGTEAVVVEESSQLSVKISTYVNQTGSTQNAHMYTIRVMLAACESRCLCVVSGTAVSGRASLVWMSLSVCLCVVSGSELCLVEPVWMSLSVCLCVVSGTELCLVEPVWSGCL